MKPEADPQTNGDDADLIHAIANQRDASALSELLNRHQSACYALALRIVGNRDAAEDIVQDVMVRVWTTASTYRGDGPVRAWLMRIAARESINAIKKIKRTSVRMKSESADLQSTGVGPQGEVEASELQAALRQEFERLPELERQLLGLHYGGGLSQQEISDAMSIPQQTISNHLNRTLKTLRAALSTAGYSAPTIAAVGIGDAFCSGISAPPGLRSVVLNKIAAKKSMRSEREVRPGVSQGSKTAIILGATVVLSGVVLWFSLSRPSTPESLSSSSRPAARTASTPMPYDWHRQWSFEKGVPEELKTLSGIPIWNDGSATVECQKRVDFTTTHPLPGEPMLFTMKCNIIDLSKNFFFHQALGVDEAVQNSAMRELNSQASHKSVSTREIVRCLYIYEHYWATTMNGEVSSVSEIEKRAEGGVLQFGFENLSVQSITATPLRVDELPDFVRNPVFDSKN